MVVPPPARAGPDEWGLAWQGRWGGWSAGAVRVLATCVALLEVTLQGVAPAAEEDTDALFEEALREVEALLSAAACKSGDAVLARVHWAQGCDGAQALRRGLRAALLCDAPAFERLRRDWRHRRPVCKGRAAAFWSGSLDTGSEAHAPRVARLSRLRGGRAGLYLELPAEWLPESHTEGQDPVSAVRPGTHWHDFCQLFGAVERVERAATGGGRERGVVTLLARFCQAEGAQNMYEALFDRYLYRPWSKETDEGDADECFQVTCALKDYDEARALLVRGEPLLDSEVAFVLRRGGGSPEQAAVCGAPEEVLLTSSRPQLVLGREPGEGVDVVLRRAHVSKAHATLTLQDHGGELAALLQDTSSNGTWVNGARLDPGRPVHLRPGDRVSFLPPGAPASELGGGPLVYELALPGQPAPAAPPALGQPGAIQEWLRSLEGPGGGLLQYENVLLNQYDDVSQIRSLYADNIGAFFEDVGVENPQHKASFRRALMRLRGV